MGRPTKLDDLREARFLKAIEAGMSRKGAARACGVSHYTVSLWASKGRDGIDPYCRFLQRVEEAEAKVEANMIGCIRTAALEPKHWQAAAWWLERRSPECWSKPGTASAESIAKAEQESSEEDSEAILESLLEAARSRKVG